MKARKQGNSMVISIPKKFGVEEGKEYVAFKGLDGEITFIPKRENFYKKAYEDGMDLRVAEEFKDMQSEGRELL